MGKTGDEELLGKEIRNFSDLLPGFSGNLPILGNWIFFRAAEESKNVSS